jgi:hypothetical protein
MAPTSPRRGKDTEVGVSHTFGMKTAISLPDDVFEQAERLARSAASSSFAASGIRESAGVAEVGDGDARLELVPLERRCERIEFHAVAGGR